MSVDTSVTIPIRLAGPVFDAISQQGDAPRVVECIVVKALGFPKTMLVEAATKKLPVFGRLRTTFPWNHPDQVARRKEHARQDKKKDARAARHTKPVVAVARGRRGSKHRNRYATAHQCPHSYAFESDWKPSLARHIIACKRNG